MPKVSVIMPSYNHENYVGEAIQSILDQTYQDFEIIITDDGSSDGTVEVIKQLTDPRIKLFIFHENQGACEAANNCLKNATGELVAMISSDDVWFPDKLEKQVKFLDQHSEIGAVFSYAQFINENSQDIGYDHHYQRTFIQPNRTRFEWLRFFFLYGNCLCHPSLLIRKQCYEDVGYYDERFAQLPDYEFWIRLCLKYQIHIISENLIKFRLLKNQTNASAQTPEKLSRYTLEQYRVLKNYLNPEIYNNLTKIFDWETDIQQIGITKINDIDSETVPFLLAAIAEKKGHPSWDLFSFDILYDLCGDKNAVQKLKEQYGFNYSSLINLALKQDIFGIVSSTNTSILLAETQQKLSSCSSQLEEKEALLEKQLIDQTVIKFKKAIELKPDSALSYGNLGEVLVKQGFLEDAASCLKKAIEIKPKFYRFYNGLGLTFLKQKSWDDAISYFEKAIELKPNSAWGYYNLGLVFSLQGKLEAASNYYARAVHLNPSLLKPQLLGESEKYLPKIGVAQWDVITPVKLIITAELISVPESFTENVCFFNVDKLEIKDEKEAVKMLFSGWIFGCKSKVISVQIIRDNLLIQTFLLNDIRPDVVQTFPHYKLEENTGFNVFWKMHKSSFIRDEEKLIVQALFDDGSCLPFKEIAVNKRLAISDSAETQAEK